MKILDLCSSPSASILGRVRVVLEFKTTMKCMFFSFAFLFVFSVSAAASEPANLRVATFQCDVTPPIGHWLYAHPLKTVEHPLLAKGIVLEQAGTRYVLCAIDWCVLSNESHARFRARWRKPPGPT